MGVFAMILLFPSIAGALPGHQIIVVQGASMAPTLHVGDIIVITEDATVRVGDIVTVRREDSAFVTHRIIEQHSDGSFTLRGDANTVADPRAVPLSAIVGTVSTVISSPWSTFLQTAASAAGRITLIAAIALVFFAPQVMASLRRTRTATTRRDITY